MHKSHKVFTPNCHYTCCFKTFVLNFSQFVQFHLNQFIAEGKGHDNSYSAAYISHGSRC